ncbi:MAG: C_GCAxxG_C_C family protein [Spirochaetales bacterium]|nr:C_GCAxxG_C_C family protein [Spirochaetales bacterium]
MDKEAMMKKAYELGFKYEQDFRGCAQCAIAAMQDALGIHNDDVYKAGSGLAGGGGECTDGNCGGYTGASMVMASFFGRTREEEGTTKGREDKYVSFRMTRALHNKFVEKYGGVLCKECQKAMFGRSFDLRDDEQKQLFRESGAHEDDDKCCAAVGNGARWGIEILLDELEARGMTLADFKEMDKRS